MDRPPALASLALLCLARLLPTGTNGESRDKLAKDLAPLISGDSDRLGPTLDDLEAAFRIIKFKKGKAVRLAITAEGRRLALEAIGLDELPPKITWAKLKSSYVLARALNVADAPRLAKAPGLKAELLRAHFALDLGEKPTIKQATDALAGKLLGLAADRPFTMDAIVSMLLHREGIALKAGQKPNVKAIQDAVLRRELGETGAKNPLDALVVKSVGARSGKPADLGDAAIRSWAGSSEVAPPEVEAAFDLAAFARRVLEAARSSASGRSGDEKVFISHVWRSLDHDPSFRGMDQGAFKARLVDAHRARLLELGRGDLMEAMDPLDARDSATPFLNAVYHYVRTEEAR